MKYLHTLDKAQTEEVLRSDLQRIHDDEPASGLDSLLDAVTPSGVDSVKFFASPLSSFKSIY